MAVLLRALRLRPDAVASGGGSEGRRMKAASLGENSVAVVGFLNLNEDERQPVDQECDVRAELFVALFAGKLGDDMKGISIKVLKVDDLQTRCLGNLFVELLSEVFVVEDEIEMGQSRLDF